MQGIVSILRSDNPEKTTKAASLRRTLSADMSSKKWFADSSVPVMKKIASSEQIAIHSFSEEEEEECEMIGKGPSRVDIWTAIMSQKKQDDPSMLPPPYVHPLLKKSASSLSEKSLKICTESLGSETGSDVFSSPPSSDEEKTEHNNNKFVKFSCKKPQPARSLPPPIPSLATARTDGSSLHMHSRRVDGRLVVEAVSVQQKKYFEAQRQDGRFLLTLINDPKQQEDEDDDDKGIGILKTRTLNLSTPAIKIYKSTATIKKILERDNEISINQSWSQKWNTKEAPIVQSRTRPTGLPPLPPPTTVNTYQYFWRAKPTVASVIDPLITQHRPPTKTNDLILLRGNKADCILPSLKGCKEPRRSVLMWETFCIATS
ncbi:hypothetical protein QVD17_41571 [Tagetes erecta]|uniref:FAF domain-containing protein n=1 Tax=Tagetes erecta TaxID=13708 RepID=A0AAD8NDS9_TARER|nr:hypothetical protein QVD17_41571 [Tagetes erecta]